VNNRINDSADILKLVEISRLYYERDLTQAEIAKRMNISRPAVSKLLSEARLRGIVRIDIKSPLMSDESLLDELCDVYNLKGGLVVPSGSADEKLLARLIISQAALYIEKLLPEVTRIGLGWGDTIGRLVDKFSKNDIVIRIAPEDLTRIDKVFLIGGGEKRINAVRGTLKTGLVNHLVTDEKTARALIEMH
jgi:DNA-binding transcriptional regulator LsrR (DeoR family)